MCKTTLGLAFWAIMASVVLPVPQPGWAATSAGASADQSPDGAPVSIGSWQVQAWQDEAGAFSHCTLHRLDNGFVAAFSRSASGYALALGSVRWKLQKSSALPVLLMAGSAHAQAQALATSDKVVSISLERNPGLIPRIISELKMAQALRIGIDDETLQLPSDGVRPALAELDRCWRDHWRADLDAVGSIRRPEEPKSPAAEGGRADALVRDLALARSQIEVLKRSLASKEVLSQEISAAKKVLDEEHTKAEALARDLDRARGEIAALKPSVAAKEAAAKEAAAGEIATRKALDQEHARADALSRELAGARKEIETLKLQVNAREALAQENAAAKEAADQERARAEALARDLASAHNDIEALKAQVATREAAAKEAVAKEVAATKTLAQERARADALAQELASARDEIEALKSNANPRLAAQPAAISTPTQLTNGAGTSAASDQSTVALAPTPPVSSGTQASGSKGEPNPEAARNTPTPLSGAGEIRGAQQSPTLPSPEEARLLARAEALIKQGNITGAQLLLARGLSLDSAHAAFLLAQTYDPRQLSSWGVRGIPGDATKAQELYTRAYMGGVSEAKTRLAATR